MTRNGNPTTDPLVKTLAQLGTRALPESRPALRSHPMLAALRRAGTRHVFADSADADEIGRLVEAGGDLWEEIDGSTANQPLVRKVFDRYLADDDVGGWVAALRAEHPELGDDALLACIYALLCTHTAQDVVARFAAGRAWGASVQIHMDLVADPDMAVRVGHAIRRMAPNAVVKVPFTPHRPECFFIARDLERAGVPVNFTSTFSARQTVAAALLADVTLTNIFMGRINQGLEATLLGEHVDLAAQQALRALRRDHAAKTLLIVASVRDWQTFAHTAGCDVFTAPCSAIAGFLEQTEIAADALQDRSGASYEDRYTIGAAADSALGRERIARLYAVEPAFVEFLLALRDSQEYRQMRDGDALRERFATAGFGDFFHAPSPGEWDEIRRDKLPNMGSPLLQRFALDTLYTLLADADFEKYQAEMDAELRRRL